MSLKVQNAERKVKIHSLAYDTLDELIFNIIKYKYSLL